MSSPPLAAFRSRRLRKMISNRALNSNEALEESTATSSSVTLSGARRAKVTPRFLDIEQYIINSRNSHWSPIWMGVAHATQSDWRQHVRQAQCRRLCASLHDHSARVLRRDAEDNARDAVRYPIRSR